MVIATSMAVFSLYYVGLIGGESLAGARHRDPSLAMWIMNAVMTVVGSLAGHHGARDVHGAQQRVGLRCCRPARRGRRAAGPLRRRRA
jgi:hypothetical protein